MRDLSELREFYPQHLRGRGEDILREYLQYEILKLIFSSKYALKYTFLGGTCLRIAYGTDRFSEDLDFDNVGLEKEEFEDTARIIQDGLVQLGYEVHLKFAYKGAYHCNIRFPGLLFDYDLSPHKEARLLIKLDTEKQYFDYQREVYDLNKFGVRHPIRVTPAALLVSQKIAAVMGRKRAKGRDFYDLHFMLRHHRPNYRYLEARFGVTSPEGLRKLVGDHIAGLDFAALGRDVAPFLMHPADLERVTAFPDFWQQTPL